MDNHKRAPVLALLVLLAAACSVQSASVTSITDMRPTEGDTTTTSEEATFEGYVESSFRELIARRPEEVTALGLSAILGIRDSRLNDMSKKYEAESAALALEVLQGLESFDEKTLTPDQILTRDSFSWYLETELERYEYRLHDWPVHFLVTGYNQGAIGLFTEIHPLTNRNQVDDYLERLNAIDQQVDQVIDNLREAVANGITPPTYVVDITLSQMKGDIAGGQPTATQIYQSARDRIEKLGLNKGNTASYLDGLENAVSDSFIPAWERLIQYLESIQPATTNEISLARLPQGEDFYLALLRRHTATDLAPEQIHAIGQREAARISAEMIHVGDQAGLEPSDIGELRAHFANEAGMIQTSEVVARYQAIIDEATSQFSPYFTSTPKAELEVVTDQVPGAFYIGPASDGSRPGAFHAGTGGGPVPAYQMRSLAYHEAIPGHHFQISLAQEAELPSPQRYLTNTGQAEGWGLYAERLAADLGFYSGDPSSDFGRLDYELLRAARLVVDTGIHYLGWSRDQAISEMTELMGGTEFNNEVDRYVVYPGQATAYMVGLLAILRMREAEGIDLEDPDSLASFHDQIIGSGNVPLKVLAARINE